MGMNSMRMLLPACLLLLSTAAAAQPAPAPATGLGPLPAPPSGTAPEPEGPHQAFGRFRFHGSVFLSPMGEPFRSETPDADNVGTWFHQVDRDGDGYVTLVEMQADAARFFAILDTNHDGELDPDEVAHYENDVAPEVQVGLQMRGFGGGQRGGNGGFGGGGRGHGGGMGGGHGGMGGRGGGGMGGGRGGGGGDSSSGEARAHQGGGEFDPGLEGAGRFSFFNIPEPVISADADLNRGVSRQEFLDAAGQRFLMLDTAHHGRIARAELPPLPVRHAGKFKHKKGDQQPHPEQGRQGI